LVIRFLRGHRGVRPRRNHRLRHLDPPLRDVELHHRHGLHRARQPPEGQRNVDAAEPARRHLGRHTGARFDLRHRTRTGFAQRVVHHRFGQRHAQHGDALHPLAGDIEFRQLGLLRRGKALDRRLRSQFLGGRRRWFGVGFALHVKPIFP
jgi:hypothetical protein